MVDIEAIHVVVHGRVHGVGFRYSTRRVANDLGLAGWVRNRADGSVEVWAQGTADGVARLRAYLEQGPPGALVEAIEVESVEPDPHLDGFQISF